MNLSFFLVLIALIVLAQSKYVPTPGGTLAWDQCIHTIPDGSHIVSEKGEVHVVLPDGEIFHVPKCDYPAIPKKDRVNNGPKQDGTPNGWQVYTMAKHSGGFQSFVGTFNVPAAPQDWPSVDEAIIYLFTGLEDAGGFNIIQPVLQYGNDSSAGGGKYWGLASWWVSSVGPHYLVSKLKTVNPGDVIFGNMTLSGKTWITTGYVVGNPSISTTLSVNKPDLAELPAAYCTLEVYNITQCDYFPASGTTVNFSNMSLTGVENPSTPIQNIKWDSLEISNGCKAKAEVKSGSEVELIF